MQRSTRLTPRQIETLAWFTQGYTRAEVASMMNVTPETVKVHLKDINRVLETRSVTEAVWVCRHRLENELRDITEGNQE